MACIGAVSGGSRMQIELQHVTKAYGEQSALTDISLNATTGDVILLLGPNGAGKSTLLRLLAGIEEPSAGQIKVDGRRVGLDYRDRVGHLPQRPKFYEHLTVHSWLRYFAQLKALPPQLVESRIDDLLVAHDLTAVANRKIANLSAGCRQRLAIATAFLNDPELLLLDEPLTNLDPDVRITVTDWLTQQLPGRVTIMATHIFSGLEPLAQRLWYLDAGHLIADLAVSDALSMLQNQVWQVTQPNPAIVSMCSAILSRRLVDHVEVWRILSNTPPPGGEAVEPALEDVYGALAQRWFS